MACVRLRVAATPALAAVSEGTKDDDILVGINVRDQMNGRGGDDTISGRRGNDNLLMGGFGDSTISGGEGYDNLSGSGREANAGFFADNGDRDLAVTSESDDSVSVLKNRGDGARRGIVGLALIPFHDR